MSIFTLMQRKGPQVRPLLEASIVISLTNLIGYVSSHVLVRAFNGNIENPNPKCRILEFDITKAEISTKMFHQNKSFVKSLGTFIQISLKFSSLL